MFIVTDGNSKALLSVPVTSHHTTASELVGFTKPKPQRRGTKLSAEAGAKNNRRAFKEQPKDETEMQMFSF